MTVDATGKIWVALFGGSSIVQIDPETQTELLSVEVPVLCPTSLAFGGISSALQEIRIFQLVLFVCPSHPVYTSSLMTQDVLSKFMSGVCIVRESFNIAIMVD